MSLLWPRHPELFQQGMDGTWQVAAAPDGDGELWDQQSPQPSGLLKFPPDLLLFLPQLGVGV